MILLKERKLHVLNHYIMILLKRPPVHVCNHYTMILKREPLYMSDKTVL
jgi:hypothetical protein